MAVVKRLFVAAMEKRPAAVLCTLFLKRAGETTPLPSCIICICSTAIWISPCWEPKTVATSSRGQPAASMAWVVTSTAERVSTLVARFMRDFSRHLKAEGLACPEWERGCTGDPAADWPLLQRVSYDHPTLFWPLVLEKLGIHFETPPTRALALSFALATRPQLQPRIPRCLRTLICLQ